MTLKKSQSSDPEADTLVLGLVGTDEIDRRFCGWRKIIRAAWRQPGGFSSTFPQFSSRIRFQKFLKEQQEKLYEQFSGKRKERAERQEERRKERDRRAHFFDKDRLQQLTLSPDECYVTFFQVKTSSQAETAIVPSFVTDDGFSK